MYGYAKRKSKVDGEFMATQSVSSTTGSALIAPSVSSTSADSTDEEDDFDRVLLWTVNPRPPNSKEVKYWVFTYSQEGSLGCAVEYLVLCVPKDNLT